jgi:RNA polymerase sigma-70 factor (ECF subfamily)
MGPPLPGGAGTPRSDTVAPAPAPGAGQAGLAGDPAEAAIAADLARRIAAGDCEAEGELVRRYSRGVLFHLRRMSRDAALSDDLHQETFRVVIERLRGEGLAEPDRLAGFILRTARNLFLGAERKRVRRGEDLDGAAAEPSDLAPGQLAQVLQEEAAERVRALLRELPTPRDRELLLRFYVAEEDKDRICCDLGLSSLHFNRVLFRARQRFRELLLAQPGRPPAGKEVR